MSWNFYISRQERSRWSSIETDEGLYQAMLRVKFTNHANVLNAKSSNIWHQRLGHRSNVMLREGLTFMSRIKAEKLKATRHCEPCAFGKDKEVSRNAVTVENTMAAKPLDEVESPSNWKVFKLTAIHRHLVKWFRIDGGGEYIGQHFQDWIKKWGWVHESTTSYTPEPNASAER